MGGGTSPTCSVKHKLALLLKLATSWKSTVNAYQRRTRVHLVVSLIALVS